MSKRWEISIVLTSLPGASWTFSLIYETMKRRWNFSIVLTSLTGDWVNFELETRNDELTMEDFNRFSMGVFSCVCRELEVVVSCFRYPQSGTPWTSVSTQGGAYDLLMNWGWNLSVRTAGGQREVRCRNDGGFLSLLHRFTDLFQEGRLCISFPSFYL